MLYRMVPTHLLVVLVLLHVKVLALVPVDESDLAAGKGGDTRGQGRG